MKRKNKWKSDDGGYLDLDRLRSGQTEFWLGKDRRVVTMPKHATIVTNLAADYTVSAEDVLWRGAAAILLTRVLEDAGYRVELWVVRKSRAPFAVEEPPGAIFHAMRLKGHGEALNVGAVVVGVSTWFLRGLMFTRTTAFGEEICRPIREEAGFPEDASQKDLSYVVGTRARREGVFQIGNIWSRSSAVSKVKKILETYTTVNRLISPW